MVQDLMKKYNKLDLNIDNVSYSETCKLFK